MEIEPRYDQTPATAPDITLPAPEERLSRLIHNSAARRAADRGVRCLILAGLLTGAGAVAVDKFIGNPHSANFGTVTSAEAATNPQANCRIQVAFHVFNYIDMYPIDGRGRPGKIDNTEDPKVGAGVNVIEGVLAAGTPVPTNEKLIMRVLTLNGTILDAAQIFRRPIPDNLRKKILSNEFDRNNPNLTEEGYGETRVITTPCNMTGNQVEVLIESSQNPQDRDPRLIISGEKLHDLDGRKVGDGGIKRAFTFLLPNDPRRQRIEEWMKKSATPVAQGGVPSTTPTATTTSTTTATRTVTSGSTENKTATPTITTTTTATAAGKSETGTATPIVTNTPTSTVTVTPGASAATPAFKDRASGVGTTIIDAPAILFTPNLELPLRGVVDVAGWLIALVYLFNRPGHIRTRIHNTYMLPVRRLRGVANPPGIWSP